MNIQTLKGFRDFLPKEARKRGKIVDALKKVFEDYGFDPLETPALEYEEVLLGKYGEEGDKLMYRFEDNGKRKVAMRYDQTVPLARVVAQYQNDLPIPFLRYQIQNVWRGENTQRGRYREFLQCDADIVGSSSFEADVRIILLAAIGLRYLGFKKFTVLINDRGVFEGLTTKAITIIDKLKKIGEEGVIDELLASGECKDTAEGKNILTSIKDKKKSELLKNIIYTLELFKSKTNQDFQNINFEYSPTLARGLDYYTSTIFEIEVDGYTAGSVCGGGRYDNLIGMFAGKQIPAVGFAYGFDRILEAAEQLNLPIISDVGTSTKVLVTIYSSDIRDKSYNVSVELTNANINTEIFPGGAFVKMEKQLKYADQKGIPYVIIVGPEEVEKNVVTLKNLQDRTQEQLPLAEVIKKLQN